MRFRLGLVVGFGAGYVLGAKAGKERYLQIRDLARKAMGTEPAQQLQAEVRDAAQRAGELIEDKAAEGVAKVSEKVSGDSSGSGSPGVTPGAPTPVTAPPPV